DPVYMDFLQGYCYDPDEVKITQSGDQLQVFIEGFWYRTILWEVPVLCLISELYYIMNKMPRESDNDVKTKAKEKMEAYNDLGLTIAEFGTRRRHSYKVHQLVVETLKKY